MHFNLKTSLLAAVLALPASFAGAQTQAPAVNAPAANAPAANTQEHDAHHPAGQGAGTATPATPATPPAGSATATPPANPQAQMGMMMGDMRQMMGMMQQMMRMMGGSGAQGGGSGGMMGGGMMGGGMPMMGMMAGQQGAGGPAMAMGPGAMAGGLGGRGGPEAMFRHTEGILAFYKAELRITDAQAAPWNAFADAVRTHAKNLREAMQRAMAQRASGTVPEQLDRRVALLSAQLDATKAVGVAGKALYAALNPEQRKLADGFMADHLRGMRGMMP